MLANIINNSLDRNENAKPIFEIDKYMSCNPNFEYYGVISKNTLDETTKIHIYNSIFRAMDKYNEYIERLNTTLDPVEYDDIKNSTRELVKLTPVDFKNYAMYNNFMIEEVIKSTIN